MSLETTWKYAREQYSRASLEASIARSGDRESVSLASSKCEALHALMLTRAPDLTALDYKLSIFLKEGCGRAPNPAGDAMIYALNEDMKHLLANATSGASCG